jgi:RNA polymerase sigma-70 factor (ECF subfamily)
MDRSLDLSPAHAFQATFEDTELYRRELQVHCYRLLGSHEDAEDMVQETLLRAWRHSGTFQGRSSLRTWLYKIATNVCLSALERRRRAGPVHSLDSRWSTAHDGSPLEPAAPSEAEPEARLVAKETMEHALAAVIQALPPRQRAALIARDVLGWSTAECAAALDLSAAALNSRLQRGRAKLQRRLPRSVQEWPPPSRPSAQERELLRRYLAATEQGSRAALVRLLRDDDRSASRPSRYWTAPPAAEVAA